MQNRIISTKMLKELDLINKSQIATAKMLKNESICFRIKFSKHESSLSPLESEATGVKMYETHTPGFCFHRNGQYRKPRQRPESSNHRIVMKIYPLVLTHGEIDPEKVICMHLLTVQSVEIPSNLSSKKTIEQALFKSLDEEELNHEILLPIYTLESECHKVSRDTNDNVKELKLINKRIEILTSMIVKTLKDINKEKYFDIIELANNKTKIIKLLKSMKFKKIFELCGKSTVLTDLKCYKAVNILPNISQSYKKIFKIKIPPKCIAAERFIVRTRNQLLKEIQIVCQKNYSSQFSFDEENEFNMRDTEFNDSIVQKIEFLEIQQKLSRELKNKTSPFEDKKTLYKFRNFNDSTFQLATQKTSNSSAKEDKERASILLRKMNNSQRIRVGKRVAELKSKRITQGLKEKNISLDEVFQEVLSKKSLENLFHSSCDEESKVLFKPFENKTMDYGEVKNMSQEKSPKRLPWQNSSFGNNDENNSNFIVAKIKQDIINKETNKKITQFLSK